MNFKGLREGDYIETREHLIFTVKGLSHPEGRTIAYLRYIPDPRGDRTSRDDRKFRRIYDLRESTEYLRTNFTKYLYFDDGRGVLLQAVPKTEIIRVYRPIEGLAEMREKTIGVLEETAVRFAEAISREAGLYLKSIGISGSLLLGLATASSDIDLIVYGEENCRRAYEALKRLREREDWVSPYDAKRVMGITKARWSETGIDLNILTRIEMSKVLHGLLGERDYFIRLVKDWGNIKEDRASYMPLGTAVIRARIKDDSNSIFTPCSYLVEDCRFLGGAVQGMVEEFVSFRGRFTEQARVGELVEARGKLERVITKKGKYLRLLLGNPRDYLIPVG